MATVIKVNQSASHRKEPKPQGRPPHHVDDNHTRFTNPWDSWPKNHMQEGFLKNVGAMLREWKSKPIPPKEEWVKVEKPTWGLTADLATWSQEIKATWLGHACFLVELPAPAPASENFKSDIGAPARGPRILFDPVFSHRCSPSQLIGPGRYTPPPLPLKQLPQVDIVVLSHNHYDHTDVATLKHIYDAQPKGSVHFFCTLGNKKWFESIHIPNEHVTELDWWDARDVAITLPTTSSTDSIVTVTCTPAQHFAGRFIGDQFATLWASWALEQRPYDYTSTAATSKHDLEKTISKVWFGGDTGLRSVPLGKKEEDMAICPVFEQIGDKFGGFDLALIPIGAFSPRGHFSPIHASPSDAVIIHKHVRSRKSIGMHWGCWALGDEVFMQDPQRLKEACLEGGIIDGEFGTVGIGETVRLEAGEE